MPGLVGIIGTGHKKVSADLGWAMRDAIRHRAWYMTDDYTNVAGTRCISRVHLGIINRECQPYSAHEGKIKIFLHGEIYNNEVAHSNPLDLIRALYEKEGLNFASFLNGSFVIVVIDENKDLVLIANDRLAAKPLFYYRDSQTVYFAPEIKSLLLVPSLERKLNLAAVADFLANGYFTHDHTLIEGIEQLDNATVLKITHGGISRYKYWEYDLEKDGEDRGAKYYQPMLAGLLHKAVGRRLRTDNTYGTLLSGGYDSRGILGCYLEARGKGGLHTISWGQEEDIPGSDCAIAKRLAQKLGADHKFYKLTAEALGNFRDFVWLGEGLTWYPESYEVFHRIREQQGVNIVLRGDECFGWEALMVYDEHTMFRSLYLHALQEIKGYQRVLKPFHYQSLGRLSTEMREQLSSSCRAKDIHNRKDFFYLNVRLKHLLNPLNYVKTFAVESLTPLLDYEILDFVSALPVQYRLGKSLYRKTVTEMFPHLFEEMAQSRNDIDWATLLRSSPELGRLVYKELVEGQNAFNEFIDVSNMKSELDSFFALASDTKRPTRPWVKTGAIKLRQGSPTAFNLMHKSAYYAQKWLGKLQAPLSFDRVILRLLILKVWGDLFLNYPVPKLSDSSQLI